LCKKKSQFYLQTWHGDFALKYIEKEVEGMLSSDYVSTSKADGAITDAAVSGSESFSQILKESFWLSENCKILEFGVPRNDLYFRGADYKDELKNRFGFSPSDKILLYAPTLRDDGSTDCFNLDFEKLRVKLCQISNEKWKIVVRLHPYLSSKAGLFKYDDNIINGSLFDDQQELFMISDVLITDYSSIMGDFFLMEKPVFLYAPDLERYSNRSTGRGLRFQLPIPFNHCQDELEAQMAEFDEEEYAKEIKAFMQTCYKPFDDGHASERIVSVFKEVMRI
jgi:CDP-glycerol glycerophosphotransferase